MGAKELIDKDGGIEVDDPMDARAHLAMYVALLELSAAASVGEDFLRTLVIKQHVSEFRIKIHQDYPQLMNSAHAQISTSVNKLIKEGRQIVARKAK